jgi:hypothetical protein
MPPPMMPVPIEWRARAATLLPQASRIVDPASPLLLTGKLERLDVQPKE